MTSADWPKLKQVFQGALDLSGTQREAWLEEACGADATLRARVEAMLAADEHDDGFIEPPRESALDDAPAEALVGQRLGAYRVVRRLGSGGMGDVYLAEREGGDFEQRVAIKLLKRGLETDELLRRFLAERRALASLTHAGIARLLDGGSLPGGRPYIVMDHVDGVPIDVWCDEQHLGVEARLHLFRRVCAAVQHAHAQLVVHCDLKPANILVTPEGEPKLLDFGIAKLLQDDAPALTAVARARPMTVEYASPEQVRGEPVGTASDVYSLGVILFELLTGHRPHRHPSRAELQRAVEHTDPPRPSQAVLRDTRRPDDDGTTVTPAAVGRARGTRPELLARRLAGDLDNIVLMALRKEPERRYLSVEQLSEDVHRHLVGLPVVSRAPTLGYRTSRFVRRNRLAVAGVVGVVLALSVGLAGMSWQAHRAELARQRADEARLAAESAEEAERHARDEAQDALAAALGARREAENVIRFLEEVLGSANPAERGRDVRVLEVLDDAAARVAARFGDQPPVEAAVRGALGRTFLAVGRLDDADEQLAAALALRRAQSPPDADRLATSLEDLGAARYARDLAEEALPLFEEALALRLARRGEGGEEVARARNNVAAALNRLGRHDEARERYERALATRRELFGDRHLLVAETLNNLSSVLRVQGQLDEALARCREALEIRRAELDGDHPLLAQSLSNLAVLHLSRGELDQAEAPLEEAVAIHRRVLGDQHPDLAVDLSNLGSLLHMQGRYDEAEARHRECLAIRRASLPADSFVLAASEVRLGFALLGLSRLEEAEPLLESNVDRFRERLGHDDPQTQRLIQAVVAVYQGTDRAELAEPYLELLRSGD